MGNGRPSVRAVLLLLVATYLITGSVVFGTLFRLGLGPNLYLIAWWGMATIGWVIAPLVVVSRYMKHRRRDERRWHARDVDA